MDSYDEQAEVIVCRKRSAGHKNAGHVSGKR